MIKILMNSKIISLNEQSIVMSIEDDEEQNPPENQDLSLNVSEAILLRDFPRLDVNNFDDIVNI